jgi:hypothetical protein
MGGVYIVPQVFTFVSERTVQATCQTVAYIRSIYMMFRAQHSHTDQISVTFREGITEQSCVTFA